MPAPPVDEEPTVSVSVSIVSPLPGASITGNSPEVAVTVTGTAHGEPSLPAGAKVYIQFGANAAWQAVTGRSTWSFTGSIVKSGPLKIAAKVVDQSGVLLSEKSIQVSVIVNDITKPEITAQSPANGATIARTGSVAQVPVSFAAIDRNSGLQRVSIYLDGRKVFDRALAVESASVVEQVAVASDSNASRILKIEAVDQVGNVAETSLTLLDPDVLAPDLQIVSPVEGAKFLGTTQVAVIPDTITVTAMATDLESGVDEVEWSLDGGSFSALSPAFGRLEWGAKIPMPPSGLHRVSVHAKDKAGNQTAKVVNFEITRQYQPKNANDLLTPRAYLEDLLWFAETHLVIDQVDPPTGLSAAMQFNKPVAM
jgi:hypothetical protein